MLRMDFTSQDYLRDPAIGLTKLRAAGPVVEVRFRDWLEEDWSRANLAIEEFLRFVSPVQFTKPRFVRKDIELGGVRLKKGDKIMAMLAAANMDPDANPRPEKLDLERRPNRHLSFGTGIHFCLGHQLARMEGKCALEASSNAGRNLSWPCHRTPFVGGSGLGSELSKSFPSRSTRNDLPLERPLGTIPERGLRFAVGWSGRR
jgi:hypothetical protein